MISASIIIRTSNHGYRKRKRYYMFTKTNNNNNKKLKPLHFKTCFIFQNIILLTSMIIAGCLCQQLKLWQRTVIASVDVTDTESRMSGLLHCGPSHAAAHSITAARAQHTWDFSWKCLLSQEHAVLNISHVRKFLLEQF